MGKRQATASPRRAGAIAVAFSLALSACGSGVRPDTTTAVDATSSTSSTSVASTTAPPTTTTTPATTTTSPPPATLCGDAPDLDGIVVPTSWELGEQRQLVVKVAEDESINPLDGFVSTPVTITALEADQSGALLEWIPGETDLSTIGISRHPTSVYESLLNGLRLERIVYRVDAVGFFGEVENLPEMRENLAASMDYLVNTLDPSSPRVQELEASTQLFATMDDASFGLLVAEQAVAYHLFDSYSLAEGEIFETPDVLPSTIFGETIPATTTTEHFVDRDTEGCEVIEIRTIPDAETLIPILMASMSETLGIDIDDAEINALAADVEIGNTLMLRFDPAEDVVRQIVVVEEVSVAGQSSVNTTTITTIND